MTDPSEIAVPDFDAVYTANQDPYGVASTFYERRKLQIVAAVLAKSTYDAAWDPACGTGHLGFYLGRPGFFPGGVGVAACWAGGATRIADLALHRLHDQVPEPMALRLGGIRTHLSAAASVLRTAGSVLDDHLIAAGQETTIDGQAVSTEARAAVAAAVAGVITQVQRIAGPAGLAFDRDLTRAAHDCSCTCCSRTPTATRSTSAAPAAGERWSGERPSRCGHRRPGPG